MKLPNEASYPITFRKEDADRLGNAIKRHDSIVLVGMNRVGISNFLRFFLYNPELYKTYFHSEENYLFIPVDLNDLVERDIYPFWVLLLKRIVDKVESTKLPEVSKKQIRKLFSQSIQLKDLFFTVDSVQKVVELLVQNDTIPVIFLLRFDRLKDVITPEFYGNLQRLKDAGNHKLSYVFTSFRSLQDLAPAVFTKTALSVFAQTIYLKPASEADSATILKSLSERYKLSLKEDISEAIIKLSGGHVQFLQIILVRLSEEKKIPANKKELIALFATNEEIMLQWEELLASLNQVEKEILLEVKAGTFNEGQKEKGGYLWNTGFVSQTNTLFSPLFGEYLPKIETTKQNGAELTKKEHNLLTFLQSKEGELCERDVIIAAVWPEQMEAGVSDWAIDRLVSRVRAKLKAQNSPYEIVTVITRGYKLVRK